VLSVACRLGFGVGCTSRLIEVCSSFRPLAGSLRSDVTLVRVRKQCLSPSLCRFHLGRLRGVVATGVAHTARAETLLWLFSGTPTRLVESWVLSPSGCSPRFSLLYGYSEMRKRELGKRSGSLRAISEQWSGSVCASFRALVWSGVWCRHVSS